MADGASDLRRRAAANRARGQGLPPPAPVRPAPPAAPASAVAPATGLHPHPLASIPLPLRPIPTEAFFDRRVRVEVPERGLRAHVYLAGLGPGAPPEGVPEAGEGPASGSPGGAWPAPGAGRPSPPAGAWPASGASGVHAHVPPVPPPHGSVAFPTPPAPAPVLSLRDRLDLPMVLCLHGAGMTGASFAPFAAHLRGVAAVVAPDARGHGRTLAGDPAALSLEDMARDALAVWERVAGRWAEGRRAVFEEEERRRRRTAAEGGERAGEGGGAGRAARLSDEETERALRAAGVFAGDWDEEEGGDAGSIEGEGELGGAEREGGVARSGARGEPKSVSASAPVPATGSGSVLALSPPSPASAPSPSPASAPSPPPASAPSPSPASAPSPPPASAPPPPPASAPSPPPASAPPPPPASAPSPPPASVRSSSLAAFLPPTVVLGHSMGGAVAVRAASLFPPSVLSGAIVVDVVEGSALSALSSMDLVLRRRPKGFASLDAAGVWAIEHGLWKRVTSLLVSLPTQLVQRGGKEEREWNHGRLPGGVEDERAPAPDAPARPLKRTDTPATLAVAGIDAGDDVIARIEEGGGEEEELDIELGSIAEGEEEEEEEEGEGGERGGSEEEGGGAGLGEAGPGDGAAAGRSEERSEDPSEGPREGGGAGRSLPELKRCRRDEGERATAAAATATAARDAAPLDASPSPSAAPAPAAPPPAASAPPRSASASNPPAFFAPLPPPAPGASSPAHRWVWRADLAATRPYWRDWYAGLSRAFLAVPCAKLLILAGTDRLDTPLTIGQMQGKFQLALFPDAGHAVHEDQPADVAGTVAGFLSRHGLAGKGGGVRPGAIVHGQRIHA